MGLGTWGGWTDGGGEVRVGDGEGDCGWVNGVETGEGEWGRVDGVGEWGRVDG